QPKLLPLLLTLAISTIFASQPLKAATISIVYSGTVISGYDTSGVFGSSGANLAGDAYTAVFTFDDSKGTEQGDGSTFSQILGGAAFGPGISQLSPGSAALTINGVSLDFTGNTNYLGQESQYTLASGDAQIASTVEDEAPGLSAQLHEDIYSTSDPFVSSYDWHAPPSIIVNANDTAAGTFYYYVGAASVNGQLAIDSVSIATAPDPGTCSLMVVGLAILAIGVTRRLNLV
ncbi:MAG TPA: hypothetical protein VHC90_19605, partial [Bryobacteraceae bacterium]|nr:hypothetical protein [Bryobacteraceae bacterium]